MTTSVDVGILHWIQQHRLQELDGFLQFVSQVTTGISVLVVIIAFVVAKLARKGYHAPLQLAATLALAGILTFALKSAFDRERPFRSHDIIEQLSEGGSSSFPSGHTLETFALATALALSFRRKWIGVPAFLWAMLVGYSRMALGVHFPSDVLGGCLLGILLGFGVNFLFSLRTERKHRDP
jgi:undecaprenyl-diphosphatase